MQAHVGGLSFSGQHQEKQDLILVLLCSLMPTAAVGSLRFHCFVPVFTMPGPAQLACVPPESSCAERTQQRHRHRQRWGAQLAFQGSCEFSHQGITEKLYHSIVCDPHHGPEQERVTGLPQVPRFNQFLLINQCWRDTAECSQQLGRLQKGEQRLSYGWRGGRAWLFL